MTRKPRTYNEERTVFSVNGIGKTGLPCAKEWNWTTILHHTQKLTQNRLKTWSQVLKPQNFYRKKTENKIIDISLHEDFLDLTPKSKGTRVKTSSWDHIRLQSFCPIKETINKMKKQPMELEKIFTCYISDKDYYPKYTRNSHNLVAKIK